jgi:siroheme synthase (precorrin-2 oxidase/ferrochelatase)
MKLSKTNKYPIVEDIVESLYTDVQELINKYVENKNEKSIFLMYINLYLMIHMSLENHYCIKNNIKEIMNDFIKDSSKRRVCLEKIEQQLRIVFTEDKIKNKLLLQ